MVLATEEKKNERERGRGGEKRGWKLRKRPRKLNAGRFG